MFALVQKHDGFSGTREGPRIDDLGLYLDAARIPTPQIEDGQVLIKVAMASINPSDLHFIKGEYGQPRVKGAPAGFEGVGEVVSGNGSRAEALVGERVAFTVQTPTSGAWAEYAVTPAAVCIPVRDDMRDEDAAGHIVNPLTALAMFDIARKAGIALTVDDPVAHAAAFGEKVRDAKPSVLLDIEAGRRSEIDFINGAVDRIARRLGSRAPVNAAIAALVHDRESRRP